MRRRSLLRYMWLWLWLLALCASVSSQPRIDGSVIDEIMFSGNLSRHSLLPTDHPNIMFWRPQKVGSSSLLSLLLSFGYRYNLVMRRKGVSNSMCLKIAACAVKRLDWINSIHDTYKNMSGIITSEGFDKSSKQYLQKYVERKIEGSGGVRNGKKLLNRANSRVETIGEKEIDYKLSLGHQICNLDANLVQRELHCAFKHSGSPRVHELFIVREPIERALSIYYFWGELFKHARGVKEKRSERRGAKERSLNGKADTARQLNGDGGGHVEAGRAKSDGLFGRISQPAKPAKSSLSAADDRATSKKGTLMRIGSFNSTNHIKGDLFLYHGIESTAPPLKLALNYATRLPLMKGMPGPSFTWSVFSSTLSDAIGIIQSDRLMSLVLSRMDESLVVASHYLGWSLADVVVLMPRKALSAHPKPADWPAEAIAVLRSNLERVGEFRVYEEANRKLDARIAALAARKVDVQGEVRLLKSLREKATSICLTGDGYLDRYRALLASAGLPTRNKNKLRDTEDSYVESGHSFSFNREILFSYDVCGSCEAHALLFALRRGLSDSVESGLSLTEFYSKYRNSAEVMGELRSNKDFKKCPGF